MIFILIQLSEIHGTGRVNKAACKRTFRTQFSKIPKQFSLGKSLSGCFFCMTSFLSLTSQKSKQVILLYQTSYRWNQRRNLRNGRYIKVTCTLFLDIDITNIIQALYAARHSILDVVFFACYYFLFKKTCYLWLVSFQTKLQTCNFITKKRTPSIVIFINFVSISEPVPSRYLFVQTQQWRQQNNVWDLLKIKNKNTGEMSPMLLSFLLAWDIFHTLFWCFLAFVVGFE